MRNKFIELAFLRNHLLSKIFTKEDKLLIESIKSEISNSKSPFTEIALYAISNCEEDIANDDFKSAGYEINLIHNFAFYDLNEWDSEYFYQIELSSYLDKAKETKRIKDLILRLARLHTLLNES